MITELIRRLSGGFDVLRQNSRLVFVAALLFVFPIVFVTTLQSFFTTAKLNIETTQKQSISLLHDSLAFDVSQIDRLSSWFTDITKENQNITKLRILVRDEEGFRIVAAESETAVDTIEVASELLASLPASANTQSIIFETSTGGTRMWQAFRKVEYESQTLYIFSEHDFSTTDSILLARERNAYITLSFVFFFILGLAYWINRQTEWSFKYSRLQQTLDERDDFTHMIAHEFRTPLTAIKGYASFLKESSTVTTEEQRFAANIFASAERLVVLVNDFLEVARIQSRKLTLQPELVDIETVITEVCDELRPIATESGLHLVYHKQQEAMKLHTDKNRLHQILLNIVTNSLKYTEEGSVEVEAIQKPQQLIIKVKDTGKGMTAEDQQKLFKQFVRVGNVDNTAVVGSGLGMWITKQLVELLGGTIAVESIEAVGTHVIITFPH